MAGSKAELFNSSQDRLVSTLALLALGLSAWEVRTLRHASQSFALKISRWNHRWYHDATWRERIVALLEGAFRELEPELRPSDWHWRLLALWSSVEINRLNNVAARSEIEIIRLGVTVGQFGNKTAKLSNEIARLKGESRRLPCKRRLRVPKKAPHQTNSVPMDSLRALVETESGPQVIEHILPDTLKVEKTRRGKFKAIPRPRR